MNSLYDFINLWLKYLKNSRNLSQNTIDSYASDLKQLIRFLNEYKDTACNLSDFQCLSRNDIRAWILSRKNARECAKTISRGISATKSFVKFLIKEDKLKNSDILTMRAPKIEKTLPRPLSISQINDILASISSIKQTNWIIKRDKALLVMIYSVGLRVSEALSLNRDDISVTSNSISVLGKGGKMRVVPLLDIVKDTIFDYLNTCEHFDATPLFVNKRGGRLTASAVQKLMKKSRELLGLSEKVTVHALRHSCATHLMENSGDLRSIQELLGHSSISSTQIYADVAKKYIAEIYDKCHPLSKRNASMKSGTEGQ